MHGFGPDPSGALLVVVEVVHVARVRRAGGPSCRHNTPIAKPSIRGSHAGMDRVRSGHVFFPPGVSSQVVLVRWCYRLFHTSRTDHRSLLDDL